MALILIGIGPIVLTAAKKNVRDAAGDLVPAFTAYGLVLATTVTVGGAAGELWIGWKSGQALDLGGWENRIVVAAALAGALLIWYTLATFDATLKAGTTPPSPAKPSDVDRLIAALNKALKASDQVDNALIPAVLREARAAATTSADIGATDVASIVRTLHERLDANGDVPHNAIAGILGEVAGVTAAGQEPAVPLGGQRRTVALL